MATTLNLRQRYARHYHLVINYLYDEDFQHSDLVRALVRQELPNLRHALEILLQEGMLEDASGMANSIARFLTLFGMTWECDAMLKRVAATTEAMSSERGEALTTIEYSHEITVIRNERERGNAAEAFSQLTTLLRRIQAQPEGTETGPGSYYYCKVLKDLAECLQDMGQYRGAERDTCVRLLPSLMSCKHPSRMTCRDFTALCLCN